MQKNKKNKKDKLESFTTDPLDLKNKVRGETDFEFSLLPKKIEPLKDLPVEVLDNKESYSFYELHRVKYLIERLGDNPHRIALELNCDLKRARKLISDVYNIVYTLDTTSSIEQRRRVKLRHIALIDKVIETGYAYLEGEKGLLSAGEFKQISETILKALSNKAKMHGIGDKIIFEQFNIQNNTYNMTDAQKEIEKDKDKRMIIDQLETLVLEKQKSIDIIE